MGDMILYRSTNGFGADLTNYKVMTVVINEADSNPATCCSYADDAVNMQSGSSANAQWQEFFGYKPCLFKNGQVVGYLNPNDYSKFENGSSADITSGNAGDVMIEFPRRGIRCVKDGTTIRISMTDAPNDPDFKYYAHTRGLQKKDAFYVGAYLGWVDTVTETVTSNQCLRSLSGRMITKFVGVQDSNVNAEKPFDNCYKFCQRNGSGYEAFPYVLLQFIQVMYVLQFKNLNSIDTLGIRYVDESGGTTISGGYKVGYRNYTSGTSNTLGLFHKNNYTTAPSCYTESTKVFGLEDLLSVGYFCDGIIYGGSERYDYINGQNAPYPFLIGLGLSEYKDDYSGYTVAYIHPGYYDDNYCVLEDTFIRKVVGKTEGIFLPSGKGGSSSTYYCDYVDLTHHDEGTLTRIICCRTPDTWYAVPSIPEDLENWGLFAMIDGGQSTDDILVATRLSYI